MPKTLIHYYANIEGQTDGGMTALHLAALVGNNNMVRILLDLGADIEKTDIYGDTALFPASYAGHVSTVWILLERGANANHRNNVNGWTAQQYASQSGRTNVVVLLHSWGR